MTDVLYLILYLILISIIVIGIIVIGVTIIIKDNDDNLLNSGKTELQFKECEVRKFLYKPLNNYDNFNEFIFEKERLSKPLIKGICDSDEEYKIEVNNRKNDYIYNKIRRYDIPINELYNLSYDQENELLVFTGLPFQNKTYFIHNGKLNTGGKLISSCFGQSYISNDSNITVKLLFNHFGNLPNFSFPIERKLCKRILNVNGISASLILEINNVYHKHTDNSSTAYSYALIELREYDTFEIECNLKGISINMIEIDEDTNELLDFTNMFEIDENTNELPDFIKIKCFETIEKKE